MTTLFVLIAFCALISISIIRIRQKIASERNLTNCCGLGRESGFGEIPNEHRRRAPQRSRQARSAPTLSDSRYAAGAGVRPHRPARRTTARRSDRTDLAD